jgi:hypothetical protein
LSADAQSHLIDTVDTFERRKMADLTQALPRTGATSAVNRAS